MNKIAEAWKTRGMKPQRARRNISVETGRSDSKDWQLGFSAACENMSCGHPKACFREGECFVCALVSRRAVNDDAKHVLLEAARRALAEVKRNDSKVWLDGVEHGAEIVVGALERA